MNKISSEEKTRLEKGIKDKIGKNLNEKKFQ